jgi:hypothetical protein
MAGRIVLYVGFRFYNFATTEPLGSSADKKMAEESRGNNSGGGLIERRGKGEQGGEIEMVSAHWDRMGGKVKGEGVLCNAQLAFKPFTEYHFPIPI